MAMSPFALTMLGMEPVARRRQGEEEPQRNPTLQELLAQVAARTPEGRPRRERATSHYNPFQTVCAVSHDSPPSYAIATRHQLKVHRPPRNEPLPQYSCSVEAEARLLLQLESINPLHGVSESDWREVYVVLRGTLLSIHRVKDGGKGKLLRSYTLQHAEVGLATDSSHTVLIPQTRLAHLIPTSARRKAYERDPDMFRPVRQTILRIRVETDQILLADASEDRIHDLIHAISAGIDISHDLNERSIPRQSTVPRRRRRRPRPRNSGDLNDPAVIADQERILREMYPTFAQRSRSNWTGETEAVLRRTRTQEEQERPPLATPAREEDELDLAVMREDFAAPGEAAPSQNTDGSQASSTRPAMSRQTTASSTASSADGMIYATAPTNFNSKSGKWQPPHPRTQAQIQRYARRCIPILLADTVRASDVLICHGKRVKINWRMELLEEWELIPPTYRAHNFPKPVDPLTQATTGSDTTSSNLSRSKSQSSQTPSAANSDEANAGSPHSSRSVLGDGGDRIEPIDTGLANLELSKVQTTPEKQSSPTRPSISTERPAAEAKREEARQQGIGNEVHGVVFCF